MTPATRRKLHLLAATPALLAPAAAPAGPEPGVPELLNASFGATVTADGDDWVDGPLRFRRLPDGDDAAWPAGRYEAFADAAFTPAAVAFGYLDARNRFVRAFDVVGGGSDADGSAALTSPRFAASFDGAVAAADPALNGGRDALVTFAVEDADRPVEAAAAPRTFMLFWDDLSGRADTDHNDLALFLDFTPALDPEPGATATVPLPAGGWAGLGLLGALGMLRLKQRRRR